jgi:hypothetical protein
VTAGASLDLSSADPSIDLADGSNLWNPGHERRVRPRDRLSLSFLMHADAVGDRDLDLVRKWWLYGAYLGARRARSTRR